MILLYRLLGRKYVYLDSLLARKSKMVQCGSINAHGGLDCMHIFTHCMQDFINLFVSVIKWWILMHDIYIWAEYLAKARLFISHLTVLHQVFQSFMNLHDWKFPFICSFVWLCVCSKLFLRVHVIERLIFFHVYPIFTNYFHVYQTIIQYRLFSSSLSF